MKRVAKYVVYDPPSTGLPYLAALFVPDTPPRVFVFQSFEQAEEFLTSSALEELGPVADARQATRPEAKGRTLGAVTHQVQMQPQQARCRSTP